MNEWMNEMTEWVNVYDIVITQGIPKFHLREISSRWRTTVLVQENAKLGREIHSYSVYQ